MPKYYFNLFNDLTARDTEGVNLPDLATAKAQARTGAAQMIAEQIIAGKRLNTRHRIEVEDENGEVVFVLGFDELVDCAGEAA